MYPVTPDGRYFVVRGRLWRCSDPSLPPDRREALVREHDPLVRRIALHLAARLPASVALDDLLQSGLMGLLDAARHYQGAQGASFATYAGIVE